MSRKLQVHLLPALTTAKQLAGGLAVVIDVLRASTTIATALHHEAISVIPCLDVADALSRADELPRDSWLLGGERKCVKIEGFDLGNSPAEYMRKVVAGKTVIFTTTNGTKALLQCEQAALVLFAAFVNTEATVEAILAQDSGDVHLLCAGTEGHISREDVLFAGCLASQLMAGADRQRWKVNDSTDLALAAWRGCERSNLASELRVSRGGRNLIRRGLDSDIALAAQVDTIELAVQYTTSSGIIERM